MTLSIREFFTSDVGQERLKLTSGVLEVDELFTRVITVKTIAVTDVEKVARHGQSGGPGWGTRLPTVSEPGVGRDDVAAWHRA